LSYEFLFTSLIVVFLPGAGVIYTVSTGLFEGWRASIAAAFGCTAGIVPHLVVSSLGLSTLLQTMLLLSKSSAWWVLRICCFWHGPCGGKQDHCNFLQSKLRTGNLSRLFGKRFWSTFSTRNCRFFSFVPPVVYCSFFLFPHQADFGTERGFHADDPGNLHPLRIICPRSQWVSESLNFMEGLASTRIRGDLCRTGS